MFSLPGIDGMEAVRSGPGVLDAGWGGKCFPRGRFGSAELLRWLEDTQDSNERAKRSHAKRRAAPPCTSRLEPSL